MSIELNKVAVESPIKTVKGSEESVSLEKLLGSSEESFSSILGSIDLEQLLKLDVASDLSEVQEINLDSIKNLNLKELVVEDLIKLVAVLNGKDGLLKSDFVAKNFKEIANNATALNEFKQAKDIKDLVSLANKYDLNLNKLEFSKEKVTKFDNLLQKIQTANPPVSLQQAQTELDVEVPLKTLSVLDKKSVTSEQVLQPKDTKSASVLKDLLVNVSKEVERPKEVKSEVKTTNEHSSKVAVATSKESASTVSANTQNVTALKDVKIEAKPELQTAVKATVVSEEKEFKAKPIVEIKATKDLETSVAKPNNVTQATPIKTQQVVATNEAQLLKEVKVVDEEVLRNSDVSTEKSETVEHKTTSKEVRLNTNDMSKVQIKETLSKFSTSLEDQVREYKPPLMKVKLALNPHSLGEVDVTIVTRGNNININLASNTQTMTIFTQNQADFRAAISNLGFSEFNMSFQDKEGQQQKEQEQDEHSNTLEDEEFEEETTSIDILTPNYV